MQMEKNSDLTLIDLAVIVCLMVLGILVAPVVFQNLDLFRRHGRVVCGTNLKGLGNACVVYANDYDDEYPRLGYGYWARELGFRFDDITYRASSHEGASTISSSLYMLVREADVSPKSFICPGAEGCKRKDWEQFDGKNKNGYDLVQLWDFGLDPYRHVSYAYHNPYGKHPPSKSLSPAFAIAADMNPWFDHGDIQQSQTGKAAPQVMRLDDPTTWKYSNSLNHELKRKRYSQGQCVLFADGHTSFETQPNVGVNDDNIYTFWSVEKNPTEQERQGGTAPTSRGLENDAQSKDDSFLAI
ncbi:MAG: hypothetical protein LLF76_07240 [Planctomycetaceae bacterium]|nr:hypothetical protein [Planctomycetaceae bacterium]